MCVTAKKRNRVKILFFKFSFLMMHALLGENMTCVRATFSSLCVCQIALAVPRYIYHFDMVRATFFALWACQIALTVARCSF